MNLLNYCSDKYSATGNDGITEHIFQILGVKNGVFVEFGAWDGVKGSNCRKLFEEGWSGLFIESDDSRYQMLCNNYRGQKRIACCRGIVGFENWEKFDFIVDGYINKDVNIDFCSIDIDGLDLETFETFERRLPTVVCIEGGQVLHPFHKRLSKDLAQHNIQQSLEVMDKVFREKGYRLLCTYQDSFYIKEHLFKQFDVSENLMEQYLNGLLAISRRIPYIWRQLMSVGLENPIINRIMQEANYTVYGWDRRKEWAIVELPLITQVINKIKTENGIPTTENVIEYVYEDSYQHNDGLHVKTSCGKHFVFKGAISHG